MIYFDNAATTRPIEQAISAFLECCETYFGNPSSLHGLGVASEKILNEARKTIADAISCDPNLIYFNSGATESNNFSLFGIAKNYGKRKKKIVTTNYEHPSVLNPLLELEKNGFTIVKVETEELFSAVDAETCMVSAMLVNNQNGEIFPLEKQFSMIKRAFPEVVVHCDGVQAFMKIPLSLKKLNCDILTLSAHKIGGIKGVGAVFIKKGIRVAPLILGGGQEKGSRAGTEAVPLIAAFSAAVKVKNSALDDNFVKVAHTKDLIFSRLEQIQGVSTLSVNNNQFSPYIIAISLDNIMPETMLHFLENRGIYLSSGSACSKNAKKNGSFAENKFVLRVSINENTTQDDVEKLCVALAEGIDTLAKVKM